MRRGVRTMMTTPSYASADYTRDYDAELAAQALAPYSGATIGLVGTYQMSHAVVDYLQRGKFSNTRFTDATELVDRIKIIKSAEELDRIRETARMQDAAMEAAFDLPAPSGRIVFVGFQPQRVSFANPDFHRRELTVVSSRNSTPAEFTRVIGLLESGQIDTTPWITHRAGYDDVVETFPSWLEPETGVVKAMLELT